MEAAHRGISEAPRVHTGENTPLLPESAREVLPSSIDDPQKSGTIFSSCSNLCGCALGASMLSLPYVLYISGPVWGVLLLLCSGLLSTVSAQAISEAGRKVQEASYSKITKAILGTRAGMIVEALLSVSLLLAAITYIVGLADVTPLIVPTMQLLPRSARVLLILIIEFWATLVSDLSVFGPASALACVGCYIQAGAMILELFRRLLAPGNWSLPSIGNLTSFSLDGLLYSFPLTSFVYAYHYIYTDTIAEFKNSTLSRTLRLNVLTLLTLLGCYVPFTISAYLVTANGHLGSNVLTSFEEGSPIVFVARVSIVALLVLTYPLLIIPLRRRGEALLSSSGLRGSITYKRILVSAALALVVAMAAITLTDLGFANAFAGGCLATIMFFFPGLFMIVHEWNKRPGQSHDVLKASIGASLILFSITTLFLGLFGKAMFPNL